MCSCVQGRASIVQEAAKLSLLLHVLRQSMLGCFRVTPRGSRAVEAHTATAAWAALFAMSADVSHGHSMGKTAGIKTTSSSRLSGARAFGFSHPAVAAAVRKLPDVHRCERYCGWPDEEQRPAVPPLVQHPWLFKINVSLLVITVVFVLVRQTASRYRPAVGTEDVCQSFCQSTTHSFCRLACQSVN
jgi:hypothetical protein